jgi:hypothetical protein
LQASLEHRLKYGEHDRGPRRVPSRYNGPDAPDTLVVHATK